jgi:hypothetical protein
MNLSPLRSRWVPVVLLCVVALFCPVPGDRSTSAAQSEPLIAQEVWPPPESPRRFPSRQTETRTQNDCARASVRLSEKRFKAEGGSGVVQTDRPSSCFSVNSLDPFIRIEESTGDPDRAEFSFRVAANPGPDRRGTIFVTIPTLPVATDYTLDIFQEGGGIPILTVRIVDPLVPANGGKVSVEVLTSGISWVVNADQSFITTEDGSGTGNGNFNLIVGANTTNANRTAEFFVNEERFVINQPGGSECNSFSQQSNIFTDPLGGNFEIDATSSSGCYLVANTDSPWIQFEDRVIGPGDTKIRIFVLQNAGTAGRKADLRFNDDHWIWIHQTGTGVNSTSAPFTSPSFGGSLTPSSGFSLDGGPFYSSRWKYVAPVQPGRDVGFDVRSSVGINDPQALFYEFPPGSNVATLVASNDDNGLSKNARVPPRGRFITPREGMEYILEVTTSHELETGPYEGKILERPTNCAYTLNLPSQYFTRTGGPGQATVNTQAGCPWEAISQAPWLRITNGGQKTGTGTFNYAIDENPDTGLRVGKIDIEYAEQTAQLKQYGTAGPISGSSAQLQRDDGTVNTGAAGDNLAVVACLTPPAYPFTAISVTIHLAAFQGQPSPVGKSMQLIGLAAPATGAPPPFSPLLVNRPVTVAQTGFNTYNLSENPTITSGSICLGVRTPTPFNGIIPSIDTNNQGNSYFSRDNANNFSPLLVGTQRTPANLMVRINGMSGVGGACTSLLSSLLARFDSAGGAGMFNLTTGSS